jgi:hypothetical integral membrane protein (TIGR02206 family)
MHKHVIVEILGDYWWKGVLFSTAGIFALLIIGKLIPQKNKNLFTVASGLSLVFINAFIHFYQISRGEWSAQSSLPLNLCSLSAILSGIVLLWRNQLAFEFLLYWGIPGAAYSILTPEMTLGNEGWYTYDYYISHAGIIFSALYLVWFLNMRPGPLSWWKVFLYSQILLITVGIIDKLIGANYMYALEPPVVDNPLVIGKWPWYILGFEVAGIFHFFLLYFFFRKRSKKKVLSESILITEEPVAI